MKGSFLIWCCGWHLKERQETQGEELSPALHAPASPLAGNSWFWLEADAKAPSATIKVVPNTQNPFVITTPEQSRTECFQAVC